MLTTSARSFASRQNARLTEMMWIAMNSLLRTKTLASRDALGLDVMRSPFLSRLARPTPVGRLVGRCTQDKRRTTRIGFVRFYPSNPREGNARTGRRLFFESG